MSHFETHFGMVSHSFDIVVYTLRISYIYGRIPIIMASFSLCGQEVESSREFSFDRCVDLQGAHQRPCDISSSGCGILDMKHVIRSPSHPACPIPGAHEARLHSSQKMRLRTGSWGPKAAQKSRFAHLQPVLELPKGP